MIDRRRGGTAVVAGLVRAASTGLLCLILVLVSGATASAAPVRDAAPSPTPQGACPSRQPARPDHAPVLAHFYIWYTASSWNRAKVDYPAVGRYSSDQVSVMRKQVQQAQAAGIDGFIVSWKSTDTLNSRLASLRGVAANAGFKLAITYEAQDFNRNPLPAAQVRDDLLAFADKYANDPVFRVLGDRPVVAISGTWHYSIDELRSITEPVADRLTVLATEKNTRDYERVSSAVDGELYYWSSADPETTPHYQDKLQEMANAVRAHCGLWVAPVTPGFDARKVGGARTVDRRNGATLRRSWEAAVTTVPDMIGVISWNEWSENTYIEPSATYGTRSLDVLRGLTGAPSAPGGELDSSGPPSPGSPVQAAIVGVAVLGSMSVVTVLGIRRRKRPVQP
jgi:Glycosyl hydrolase family 99